MRPSRRRRGRFSAWRTRPGPERGKLLSQVAQRMLADERRLAELCTRENGKPIAESVAEVRYAASFLSWFAGEAERIYGRFVAQIARLRIGRGSDEGTDLGPVIDDRAVA